MHSPPSLTTWFFAGSTPTSLSSKHLKVQGAAGAAVGAGGQNIFVFNHGISP